jgi:hypothetical protein
MSLIFSVFHYFYSSNSLFAIPANQEFVFVQTKLDPLRDSFTYGELTGGFLQGSKQRMQ